MEEGPKDQHRREYAGTFEEDSICGRGRLTYENQDYLDGWFKGNKALEIALTIMLTTVFHLQPSGKMEEFEGESERHALRKRKEKSVTHSGKRA